MRALYAINFQIARNEDWADVFALTDEAGTALDLTGATFAMDLKKADGTVALSLTTGNGRLPVHDALSGLMGPLVLKSVLTSSLPAGVYKHDCLMTLGGRVQRLWYGDVTVLAGVTA